MTTSTVTRDKPGPADSRHPSPVARVIGRTRVVGPRALRVSLATVFIWFGALKVIGASPVEGVIAETVPFLDPIWFVPLLGVFEVVVGAGLLMGAHPLVLAAMSAHLVGTFSVLVIAPELTFEGGNPLMLTTEGEFVMKNLVLLAAAATLVGTNRLRSSSTQR